MQALKRPTESKLHVFFIFESRAIQLCAAPETLFSVLVEEFLRIVGPDQPQSQVQQPAHEPALQQAQHRSVAASFVFSFKQQHVSNFLVSVADLGLEANSVIDVLPSRMEGKRKRVKRAQNRMECKSEKNPEYWCTTSKGRQVFKTVYAYSCENE